MTPKPWHNVRVVSTLALVFLAGASAGALSMHFGLHARLHPGVVGKREPSREAVLRRFRTNLVLSTEQSEQISMVLEDYRHYYESLWDQLDDLRSSGKKRILQVLNPAQRAKFEKMTIELGPQLDGGAK